MPADINVVTIGVIGPTGPASVAVGSVITTRGAMPVGNSVGTPVALLVGASGTYIRSNGTDKLNSVILAADLPTGIDVAKLNTGVVSNAELNYLDGVTSAIQTQINAKAATAHNHLTWAERGIFATQLIASSATPTDNTASTVTWATALDFTVGIPAGTWTIHVDGSCNLKHSAGGSSQFRVSIDGNDSSPRTPDTLSSTIYTRVVDANQLSALSGTIHIYCQFRTLAGSAGTTYANNPKVFVIGERTS